MWYDYFFFLMVFKVVLKQWYVITDINLILITIIVIYLIIIKSFYYTFVLFNNYNALSWKNMCLKVSINY